MSTRTRYVQAPTGDDAVAYYARLLAIACGPAIPAPDGSINAADLRAIGAALADVESTLDTAINNAFPLTVTTMLEQWERAFRLPQRTHLTTSERQQRLHARVLAARVRGTSQGIKLAIEALVGACELYETSVATAQSAGDPRKVYLIAVVLPSLELYNKFVSDVRELIAIAKPAHVKVNVALTRGFKCDDTNSRVDRDVLAS